MASFHALLLLACWVACLAYIFCRVPDKRALHRRAKRVTKDPRDSCHVERVNEDAVPCLEDEHEVEGSANAQR